MSELLPALTYGLDNRLRRLRRARPPLEAGGRLLLLHLSTPEHLKIFLEAYEPQLPRARLRILSRMRREELLERCQTAALHDASLDLEIADADAAPPRAWRRPDHCILLHARRYAQETPRAYRALRAALARCPCPEKTIVDEDGSIWRGDFAARLQRSLIRRALRLLQPRLDRIEKRRMAERLLDDPGYRPEEFDDRPQAPDYRRRRRILEHPMRIEQCEETATLLKQLRLDVLEELEIYGEDYHGPTLPATLRDWDQAARDFQAARWRNFRAVGGGPAPAPGARALDVGCGNGLFADLLQRHGYQVLGIDLSVPAVEKMRRLFPACRFEVLRLEDIPEDEQPWDLVVLSHVLEHARDERRLLATLRRRLRPESGRLYIEVPWARKDLLLERRPEWHRQLDHYREYSKRGLYQLLRGMGYEVLAHADSAEGPDGDPFQFLMARVAGHSPSPGGSAR